MEVNTLVRHKGKKFEGIGCVSKVLSKKVKVNHGTEAVMTCDPSQLVLVDVSKCKTMTMREIRKGFNDCSLGYVIMGNELKNNVGICLVSHGVVTESDLLKYPRAV